MNYFEGLNEEDSIKQRYKELAKRYHPDLGGDTEIMKAINLQYEKVLKGEYQRQGKSITEVDELFAKDEAMRQKMHEILGLEDLIVELCGCWLWVTGNTIVHREALKAAKFLWSGTKKAWYWRAEAKKWFSRGNKSLDDIRATYGSSSVGKGKGKAMIGA